MLIGTKENKEIITLVIGMCAIRICFMNIFFYAYMISTSSMVSKIVKNLKINKLAYDNNNYILQ